MQGVRMVAALGLSMVGTLSSCEQVQYCVNYELE